MFSRLSPQFLLVIVLLILIGTGIASVIGFHQIGNLLVDSLRPEAGRGDELGEIQKSLEVQGGRLLKFIHRPITPEDRTFFRSEFEKMEVAFSQMGIEHREEKAAIAKLRGTWDRYREGSESYLASDGGRSEELAKLLECFGNLRRQVALLALRVRLNTSSVRRRIRDVARMHVFLTVALTSLGMITALAFHHRFANWIVRPLRQLTAFVSSAAEGTGGVRFSLPRAHENVIELSAACNSFLERSEKLLEEAAVTTLVERRMANVLIEGVGGPAIALNNALNPIRMNAAARAILFGEEQSRGIEALQAALRDKRELFAVDGARYTLAVSPLAADGSQGGLLVRFEAAS